MVGNGTTRILVPFTMAGTVIQKAGVLEFRAPNPQRGKIQIDPATVQDDTPLLLPSGFVLSGSGTVSGNVVSSGQIDPVPLPEIAVTLAA
jgi:hypothetical protein